MSQARDLDVRIVQSIYNEHDIHEPRRATICWLYEMWARSYVEKPEECRKITEVIDLITLLPESRLRPIPVWLPRTGDFAVDHIEHGNC